MSPYNLKEDYHAPPRTPFTEGQKQMCIVLQRQN